MANIEKPDDLHALQDQLAALRGDYAATHEDAKAALKAKDYDRLTALSLREVRIAAEYCRTVTVVMETVPDRQRT